MARANISTKAEAPDSVIIGEGASRLVGKGIYTEGERKGQSCVYKWFKPEYVSHRDAFFALDIKAVDKAIDIVTKWNAQMYVTCTIWMNKAEVWHFDTGYREGQPVLVEPFIENFQKYNSNNGWTWDAEGWPALLQALSHFSYHITGGQLVLCDLQGGTSGNDMVLTDPVILSRTKSYGITDLGPYGISTFFSAHRCNKWCKASWTKPAKVARYFAQSMSTTMQL